MSSILDLDEVGLSAISSYNIDVELRHSGKVMSADSSGVLQIVITCADNDPIKIWDMYGLIVREINLGDSVICACFASGRDILASLRNLIVRIECTDYLPKEYLKILINASDEGKIKVSQINVDAEITCYRLRELI